MVLNVAVTNNHAAHFATAVEDSLAVSITAEGMKRLDFWNPTMGLRQSEEIGHEAEFAAETGDRSNDHCSVSVGV